MPNEREHRNDGKPRVRLEDLARPKDPGVPQAYFDQLEQKLLRIPSGHPRRVVRMRPWMTVAAAAAVALLVIFISGVFRNGAGDIGGEEAYAWLSDRTLAGDPLLEITLAEVFTATGDEGTDLSLEDLPGEEYIAQDAVSEEAILEYLQDHADLDEVANEL